MRLSRCLGFLLLGSFGVMAAQPLPVQFNARSARSGKWSATDTWLDKRVPKAGDNVQIRAGHVVTYDVKSDDALRVLQIGGTLTFARDKSTSLAVGLVKIQPGEECNEEGFDCHESLTPNANAAANAVPALEIGTRDDPIPPEITATIRLVHFEGMDTNSLPAIVSCDGRWDIHGAPLHRTWVKLAATARQGESRIQVAEPLTGWKIGDRVIITASRESYGGGSTFRKTGRRARPVQTEERFIAAIDGTTVTLDRSLDYEHFGTGNTRSEVANLSRNVIIESANPDGVRGHTMYHRDCRGGISYAEFRHLGKEGVLGKYAIHFHLVRDTMRGSGVVGASIWDSHNRWITIHGTDYLLVRDCVGYQSVGHGFFLEDATEQYNVLDRNLAVQAYRGKRLPKQALGFDPNDGAGFWWANGRNTLTRNVACENDEYGFRFEIAKRGNFDPVLALRTPDGGREPRDVRTMPFLRFEDNESHSEGLYSFNLGDDANGSVRGDAQHPFIVRNLRAWETHYALRPDLQYFLLDGLEVNHAAYGIYHPDYDAHVYRNIYLNRIEAEPINRARDDESIQYGTFTYDNVTIENSRVGRDPLVQLACTSPQAGRAGHFRNLAIKNSRSANGKVVDLGGGPRNRKLEHAVAYYFHDYFEPGRVIKVVSAEFAVSLTDAAYTPIEGFTGKDVRAADASTDFPTLLTPVDDLPPATLITSVRQANGKVLVRGVSQDNGDIASVSVNGQGAKLVCAHAGVVDWEITMVSPRNGKLSAKATDAAGNVERTGPEWEIGRVRAKN
jgi:hypothetical protein